MIPDDVIHDVTDEFFQLHGEDERCDDHVPRVLGVVVRRRTASQLRQLVAKGAVSLTQTVVPEAVGGGTIEAPGLVD